MHIELLERRLLCAAVAVDRATTFQTIAGLGGNYARGRFGDFYLDANDSVGAYTLDNLAPHNARIGIPVRGWEQVNDDADPNSMNMAGFEGANAPAVDSVFRLMQDLTRRGLPMTASIWDLPNWMVSNPTVGNQRLIPASMYLELIESIAAFLKKADEVYGARVDYLSFNEADGGYNLRLTSAEQAAFIKMAGPKFAQLGLAYTPKWLVGDTGNAQRCVAYCTPILQDPQAAPYLGPIAFHGWDNLTYTDATLTAIADLGRQYNKPVWCAELGYDPGLWNATPSPFPTWTYAIKTAQTYHRVLKLAGASVADYWEYQNDFPLLSSTNGVNTLYPAYYVIKALSDNFTPGTQVVGATSDTASVLSLAGQNIRTNRFALQLINTGTTDQTVTVTGLPGTSLTLTRSSATENAAFIRTSLAINGTMTFTLPASSVSMLQGALGTRVREPVKFPIDQPAVPLTTVQRAAPIASTNSFEAPLTTDTATAIFLRDVFGQKTIVDDLMA